MTRFFFALLFILALIGLPGSARAENRDLQLSGNEIDLLVGTPTGVEEPLDERRTRIDETIRHDFSDYLEDDFANADELTDISWSDAEEAHIDSEEAESQLLELLAETGELEDFDLESNNTIDNEISTDNVETEFKL